MKKIVKPKSFIIDRKKWARGLENTTEKHPDCNCLLNNNSYIGTDYKNGTMCCLGFYAKSCGLSSKDIINIGSPEELEYHLPNLLNKNKYNNKICTTLMKTNDSHNLSEKDRESRIKTLFKKIGITVKFKN